MIIIYTSNWCSYCYAAKKLLDNVFPIKQQIDSSIYSNFKTIKAYIVTPVMIIPRRDMLSDIQIID